MEQFTFYTNEREWCMSHTQYRRYGPDICVAACVIEKMNEHRNTHTGKLISVALIVIVFLRHKQRCASWVSQRFMNVWYVCMCSRIPCTSIRAHMFPFDKNTNKQTYKLQLGHAGRHTHTTHIMYSMYLCTNHKPLWHWRWRIVFRIVVRIAVRIVVRMILPLTHVSYKNEIEKCNYFDRVASHYHRYEFSQAVNQAMFLRFRPYSAHA